MTAATVTDEQRSALEQVVYRDLFRQATYAEAGSVGETASLVRASTLTDRLADARIVAELAGLDLTLPHFASLVDVIEQAIALPDRKDGAA